MNQPAAPPALRVSPLYDAEQHHRRASRDSSQHGHVNTKMSPRRMGTQYPDPGATGGAAPPQRQYTPVRYNYPPAGPATVTHHAPHVLATRQQPPRLSPLQQPSPQLTRAASPPHTPFVYPNGTRQAMVDNYRRRSKTPPTRQPTVQRQTTTATEEENRRKIKYIQRIWPSATHYEILRCLQQNDFHVRKTIEALVDKFTIAAAASEQSKMLMAQSIAYYNDVHRVNEQSPLQNSFIMKLQAQAVEKPQGLSGEELEKYGMLQAAPTTTSDEEGFTPAKFVSQIPDQLIPPSGKKKALLIGINYYGSKKELNGCCDDVMRMKKLITSVYGFLDKPAFITVLSDKPGGNPSLLPTKRNILGAMSWLVEHAERGDVLFFHFSGHGGQKKDLSGTEIDGFDETIMPLDYKKAGHITDDEIHNTMIKRLKNGVKLISVMDCCHSGSGMDLPFYLENNSWKQELFPKFSEGDVQLFSSCQDSETAADLMIPSWGAGGAVTLAIVSALSQNPFGWTFNTLMSQIQLFLSERKFTQKPQLSSTQRFDINRSFSFQEITANTNPMIGTKQPKRRRPQRPARDLKVPYNNALLMPPTPTPVNYHHDYQPLEEPDHPPEGMYPQENSYQQENPPWSQNGAYPQEVVDFGGRGINFPGPPRRRASPLADKVALYIEQGLKRILTGV